MNSLRVRLLMASIGLVVVALTITGALSVLLVERLEFSSTQSDLATLVVNARSPVLAADTAAAASANQTAGATGRGSSASHQQQQDKYELTFNQHLANVPLPNQDQLIVLAADRTVLYSNLYPTESLPAEALNFEHRTRYRGAAASEVYTGTGPIEGQSFLYMATTIPGVRAHWVILAVPVSYVFAQATELVVRPVLEAAAVGLILAIAVSLLLSRALTQPLGELEEAAEEIAAGNYGRRVRVGGPRELSVLTRAFNRMAEAVETARVQQRNFLADVSHELKTPLTSLIGFSQAMTDGSLAEPDEQRYAAAIINEESHRVLHLSQALLDLARAESGQIEYHLAPVDLSVMLQQVLAIVQPRAAERRLQLQLRVTPSLPPVAADADRLIQALENLFDNAVKYAPRDARVEIVASASEHQVVVDIANPVGEHRPDLELMFDRFYRADPARSSAKQGAGLGLAISRRLVRGQRGELSASIDRWDRIHLVLVLDRSTGARVTIEAPNPLADEAEPEHRLARPAPRRPAGDAP